MLFSDGTFSTAPKLFDQLYTFHAEFQGHMLPLVYSLLPNRTEDTYVRTLQYIQETCHDLGFHFAPRTFQMDFERSAHNAVHEIERMLLPLYAVHLASYAKSRISIGIY